LRSRNKKEAPEAHISLCVSEASLPPSGRPRGDPIRRYYKTDSDRASWACRPASCYGERAVPQLTVKSICLMVIACAQQA